MTAADRQPMFAIGRDRRIEIEPVSDGHGLVALIVSSCTCMFAELKTLHLAIVDDLAAGNTNIAHDSSVCRVASGRKRLTPSASASEIGNPKIPAIGLGVLIAPTSLRKIARAAAVNPATTPEIAPAVVRGFHQIDRMMTGNKLAPVIDSAHKTSRRGIGRRNNRQRRPT